MKEVTNQAVEFTEKSNHIPFVVICFTATILILLGLYFYSRIKLKKEIKSNQELSQEALIKDN